MGGACSALERRGEMYTKFGLESLNGRQHSKDLGVDRRIIF
jgi:hypothetical protein